jgi:TonB family protein
MDDSLIYRKTRLGATELAAATHGVLSPAARRVLILLDGRRSLDELSELFGAEEVEQVIFDLVARGFAREIDPQGDPETTPTVEIPSAVATGPHPAPPEPVRKRTPALAWIVVVVGASAVGAAAWLGVRANRGDDAPVAAAGSDTSVPAPAAAEAAPAAEAPAAEPAGARELPLSGLPPVTVSLAATGKARRARALAESSVDEAASEPAPEPAEAKAAPRAQEPPAPPPARIAPPPEEPIAALAQPAASAPALTLAPRAAVVPVATVDTAEATKLAAVTSAGEPRSDAIASPVASASAAAVASSASLAAPVTSLPAAAPEPAASVTPPAPAASAPSASAGSVEAGAPALGQQVAAVAPLTHPKSEPVQLRPRRHDAPEFPARALRARVYEGHVVARIWVTAEGTVDQVDIVNATPARVFDDEVKRTLSKWTFEPPGRPADTTVQFDFKP